MNITRFLLSLVSSLSGAAFLPAARECGAIRPMVFFDKDTGDNPPVPPKSLEERLTSAQDALTSTTDQLSGVTSQLAALTSERDALLAQFDSATTTGQSLLADRDIARSALVSMTAERDSQCNRADGAMANVSRLESLCSIRGIDPATAVPTGAASEPSENVYDQWAAAHGAEKTSLWRANKAEIRAEATRRERASQS